MGKVRFSKTWTEAKFLVHHLLSFFSMQSDKFLFTKVQDVVNGASVRSSLLWYQWRGKDQRGVFMAPLVWER
jgi:hypothetical protein